MAGKYFKEIIGNYFKQRAGKYCNKQSGPGGGACRDGPYYHHDCYDHYGYCKVPNKRSAKINVQQINKHTKVVKLLPKSASDVGVV